MDCSLLHQPPMWQFMLLVLLATALCAEDKPRVMSDRMLGLIRKYILTLDEESSHAADDIDIVRSLKTDHFLSKSLMPSNIPGQKEKCWNKCETGNINVRSQLLDNLPADVWKADPQPKTTKSPAKHNAPSAKLKRRKLKPSTTKERINSVKPKKSRRPKKRRQKQRNSRRSDSKIRSKPATLSVKLRRSAQPMLMSALLMPATRAQQITAQPSVTMVKDDAVIRELARSMRKHLRRNVATN